MDVLKQNLPPADKFPLQEKTEFAQAMPEQYRSKDIVKSYRQYYLQEKKELLQWKCGRPDWARDGRLSDSELSGEE